MHPDIPEIFTLWLEAHRAAQEAQRRYFHACLDHSRGLGPEPSQAWRGEALEKLAQERRLLQVLLRVSGEAAASLRPPSQARPAPRFDEDKLDPAAASCHAPAAARALSQVE